MSLLGNLDETSLVPSSTSFYSASSKDPTSSFHRDLTLWAIWVAVGMHRALYRADINLVGSVPVILIKCRGWKVGISSGNWACSAWWSCKYQKKKQKPMVRKLKFLFQGLKGLWAWVWTPDEGAFKNTFLETQMSILGMEESSWNWGLCLRGTCV